MLWIYLRLSPGIVIYLYHRVYGIVIQIGEWATVVLATELKWLIDASHVLLLRSRLSKAGHELPFAYRHPAYPVGQQAPV
jgi:hypothetical protein